MSKYVTVKPEQVPSPLRAGEYVIEAPDFIVEINDAQQRNNSRRKLTTASYLRSIANMISINYDPAFDVLRHLHAHRYEGREFSNEKELSAIVIEMLRADYPQIFEAYVDKKIKQRPANVKVIYYTGNPEEGMPFLKNGIDSIDLKEVDNFLGLKGKKAVAKATASDESGSN